MCQDSVKFHLARLKAIAEIVEAIAAQDVLSVNDPAGCATAKMEFGKTVHKAVEVLRDYFLDVRLLMSLLSKEGDEESKRIAEKHVSKIEGIVEGGRFDWSEVTGESVN